MKNDDYSNARKIESGDFADGSVDQHRAFNEEIAPTLKRGVIEWPSRFLLNKPIDDMNRLWWVVENLFENKELQREVDAFIDRYDTIDVTQIEDLYLDVAVKFYLHNSDTQATFQKWHHQLPYDGTIVHYGTSSGTESAWLMYRSPERNILQIDDDDAAVGSGQRKLYRVSRGRSLEFATFKRQTCNSIPYQNGNFADGAIINRVPPFPYENRKTILERVYHDLKPGKKLVFVEPSLEKGSCPKALMEFVLKMHLDYIGTNKEMTEFEYAFLIRTKHRCLTDKYFHMFQKQMASHFISTNEAVDLFRGIGFEISDIDTAFYGLCHHVVLTKPSSHQNVLEQHKKECELPVESAHFDYRVVPRENDFLYSEALRNLYKKEAIEQMLSPRYGLNSLKKLSANLTEFDQHIVVGIYKKNTDQVVAFGRFIPFYGLSKFDGLPEDVRRKLYRKNVVGGSIYYSDEIRGNKRLEYEAIKSFFKCTKHFIKQGKFDYFYGEAHDWQEAIYNKLNLFRIGQNFTVEGWKGTWIPIMLRNDE